MESERPPQSQRKPGGISEPADREPRDVDSRAFARLFHDAYRKCFSTPFDEPLTESESHHFSVDISESTGLEIGWKSLKNYSNYLLGRTGRIEKPSVPTLDTLARYVAGAPRTDEERRRTQERHYPFWFRYKDSVRVAAPDADAARSSAAPTPSEDMGVGPPAPIATPGRRRLAVGFAVAAAVVSLLTVAYVAYRPHRELSGSFTDDFDDVSAEALARRGWSVQSMDTAHWARRAERAGHLTLFTLEGDNWPQPGQTPNIRNLLVRRSSSACFLAELRLSSFFPRQNWQQAGILLLQDTAFAGRSVRLSIGFNDFSGGFPSTKEVIVQAITSLGRDSNKPEEIVHHRLFVVEPATDTLLRQNLEWTALRIEKRGAHLRFLSSAGPMKNAPFKEVGSAEFDVQPAYVAVFALKGFVSSTEDAPAHVDAFNLSELPCSP